MSEDIVERLRAPTDDDGDLLQDAADEIERLRAENERLREALTPKVDDTLEELANRLWSVHPKTVQDSGLTRRQWYAREIENYFVIARAALEEKK
jgi:hypothetical protein